MKILITGNLGYVGSVLTRHLKSNLSNLEIIGYDRAFFSHIISEDIISPDLSVDIQYIKDVRNFPDFILNGVDTLIHLAAISNDPMGNEFSEVTNDVNFKSTIDIAKKAKKMGVTKFVFASSCSVYGFASELPKTELDEINPLSTYAKSKIDSEKELSNLADNNFFITCLRFATAFGPSSRLRLDIVLNDFVANAFLNKNINILSDGSPWRPLIDVRDMARAIEWALKRGMDEGGNFLVINTGSNEQNFQVIELAALIKNHLPDIIISVNPSAQPDKRSYKVDFSLYKSFAKNYYPIHDIDNSIKSLLSLFEKINYNKHDYDNSKFIRLNILKQLKEKNILNNNLF